MSSIEVRDVKIKNLSDLHKEQRFLKIQVQQKELELKHAMKDFKGELSFGKIAGKGFSMIGNSIKQAVTGKVSNAKDRDKTGLVSAALRFGTYSLSSFVAEKIAGGIGSVFGKNKKY